MTMEQTDDAATLAEVIKLTDIDMSTKDFIIIAKTTRDDEDASAACAMGGNASSIVMMILNLLERAPEEIRMELSEYIMNSIMKNMAMAAERKDGEPQH